MLESLERLFAAEIGAADTGPESKMALSFEKHLFVRHFMVILIEDQMIPS